MDADRAEVRVQPQPTAEGEGGLLGPDGGRRIGPLRPAHGTEQDGVRLPARRHVLGPDRDAVGVDRDPADEELGPGDVEPEGAARGVDDRGIVATR